MTDTRRHRTPEEMQADLSKQADGFLFGSGSGLPTAEEMRRRTIEALEGKEAREEKEARAFVEVLLSNVSEGDLLDGKTTKLMVKGRLEMYELQCKFRSVRKIIEQKINGPTSQSYQCTCEEQESDDEGPITYRAGLRVTVRW